MNNLATWARALLLAALVGVAAPAHAAQPISTGALGVETAHAGLVTEVKKRRGRRNWRRSRRYHNRGRHWRRRYNWRHRYPNWRRRHARCRDWGYYRRHRGFCGRFYRRDKLGRIIARATLRILLDHF